MHKKWYLLIAVVVVLSLGACSRSASTTAVATATQRIQGSNGTPGTTTNATQDPMAMVKLFATQTAMASGVSAATPTAMNSGTQSATTPGATSLVPPTVTPGILVAATPYPTLVKPASYSLQEGEYPYCIARRYNLAPAELLDLNDLGENDLLQAGAVLNLPQTGSTFPGTRARMTHPATYVVKADDSIYRIACAFGDVDPLAIAAVNRLVAPYTLTVGQSISIP